MRKSKGSWAFRKERRLKRREKEREDEGEAEKGILKVSSKKKFY